MGLTGSAGSGILASVITQIRIPGSLPCGGLIFVHPDPFSRPGRGPVPSNSSDSPSDVEEKPSAESLDADAAALLADIDNFDLEAARKRVQEIDSRYVGLSRSKETYHEVPGNDFPEVRVARSAAAAEKEEPVPTTLAGGLLEQLRGEVACRQQVADEALERVDAAKTSLDRRLRAAFEYFHDLTTQLNYLKPPVARNYIFLDAGDAFRNLSWLEGFADFRTQAESDGGRIERVTLGYTLKGGGMRVIERAGHGVERLRQMMFDLGLRFECVERRNRLRELELGTFTVSDEISVQVVWRADFENRQVVVESRNLERFGFASCRLPAESVGPDLLDEFGRLVLGRDNRFRTYLAR